MEFPLVKPVDCSLALAWPIQVPGGGCICNDRDKIGTKRWKFIGTRLLKPDLSQFVSP
jgi:hypothetical protein